MKIWYFALLVIGRIHKINSNGLVMLISLCLPRVFRTGRMLVKFSNQNRADAKRRLS